MITKSAAFALFKSWLNEQRKLKLDAVLAHARVSMMCTVALISGDTICLRIEDSGFFEIMLSAPFRFELIRPRLLRENRQAKSTSNQLSQKNDYESAIVAFHEQNTITLMQLA